MPIVSDFSFLSVRKKLNLVSKPIILTPTSVLEITLTGHKSSYIELLIEGTLKSNIVADVEGNVYKTVTIGTQTWMAENLKTTKYNNGDLIGTTDPPTLDIQTEDNPKYQWAYNGDESYVNTYGRLYTWYAVTDSRGVCPTGWHVPTDTEWTTLENYLIANGYNYDGTTTANKIAKSLASIDGWISSAADGASGNIDYPAKRNVTGFTARPGSYRSISGLFGIIGQFGYWWCSDEYSIITQAYSRNMYFNSYWVTRDNSNKVNGFSVRCIKD